MGAQQFNQLLFMAESAGEGRNLEVLADACGIEKCPDLLAFLAYVIDEAKNRRGFGDACAKVYNNDRLPVFWRALAAHERGAATRRGVWPKTRDGYLAKAMAILAPTWDPYRTDDIFLYHSRMLVRRKRRDLSTLVYNAGQFIEHGWFHAPSWTLLACTELIRVGRSEEAKHLLKRLKACDRPGRFSRAEFLTLIEHHAGLLLAA